MNELTRKLKDACEWIGGKWNDYESSCLLPSIGYSNFRIKMLEDNKIKMENLDTGSYTHIHREAIDIEKSVTHGTKTVTILFEKGLCNIFSKSPSYIFASCALPGVSTRLRGGNHE